VSIEYRAFLVNGVQLYIDESSEREPGEVQEIFKGFTRRELNYLIQKHLTEFHPLEIMPGVFGGEIGSTFEEIKNVETGSYRRIQRQAPKREGYFVPVTREKTYRVEDLKVVGVMEESK
jgi:hypothetical protein